MNVIQAFAEMVIAAKGTVVNGTSIAGVVNSPWIGLFLILIFYSHVVWFGLFDLSIIIYNIGLYNASKAALISYSETLKLEMDPFGVKVVTLMTGVVDTNIFSRGDVKLPANSIYQKAAREMNNCATGTDLQSKTSTADFARAVVRDVLGGASGPVWRGRMASIAWFMSTFAPVWLLVNRLSSTYVCVPGSAVLMVWI